MQPHPNILFINTDQQHFQALSFLGNKWVHTPNIDRIMNRGTSFSLSYSADPVCCPARAAWYTGRIPSRNGMADNRGSLDPELPDLGQWLGTRGYHCFYTGKWHVPGRDPFQSFTSLAAEATGIGEHGDFTASRTAQSFLNSYNGDDPFFLSVGFLQPHDCCYWVYPRTGDIDELPYALKEKDLPPLPANFDHTNEEPPRMRGHMNNLRKETAQWSTLQWRYYIWSYYRMVEMADAEIGRVIDALESSRHSKNTVIIFTSDHGDGLACRKMHQKWWLYDESVRVPLVIVPPGGGDGRIDSSHVVSGLDLPATICDYADVENLPRCAGSSLRPLVEGRSAEWRDFAVAESYIIGRMVRTPQYKFITYKGETPELLFDMDRDPWEMHNLMDLPEHSRTVAEMRKILEDWERVNS